MTKFEEVVKFVARRKTFKWGDVNRHFCHPIGSLNSYTTYLNTLRRAGLIKQTARGVYEVTDVDLLKATSLREISLKNKLQKADALITEKQNHIYRLERSVAGFGSEKAQLQDKNELLDRETKLLREYILDLDINLARERQGQLELIDRLNTYDERIAKFNKTFFGRLAKLFKRSV